MKKSDYIEDARQPEESMTANEPAMPAYAATINIPVTIPQGVTIDVEKMKAKLTEFALTLLHTEGGKEDTARKSPYISPYVLSIGQKIEMSANPEDDKKAYRKYLEQKYE